MLWLPKPTLRVRAYVLAGGVDAGLIVIIPFGT